MGHSGGEAVEERRSGRGARSRGYQAPMVDSEERGVRPWGCREKEHGGTQVEFRSWVTDGAHGGGAAVIGKKHAQI